MFKKWLLIGMIALTPTVQADDFKPSSPITTLMPIVMDNLDRLDLTPAQLDKVRAISRDNFAKVEYINAKYNDIKSELKEITLDVEGNKTHALKLVDELGELDKQRMRLTVECAFGLKNVLNAEQFAEVIATLHFNQGS
jgi:capsule polysaccharide export protein KpsE/RkpR